MLDDATRRAIFNNTTESVLIDRFIIGTICAVMVVAAYKIICDIIKGVM